MVNEEDRLYRLHCNERHRSGSHSDFEGKFFGPFQKAAVVRAVQNYPNATGAMVIRNMVNVEDQRV